MATLNVQTLWNYCNYLFDISVDIVYALLSHRTLEQYTTSELHECCFNQTNEGNVLVETKWSNILFLKHGPIQYEILYYTVNKIYIRNEQLFRYKIVKSANCDICGQSDSHS